MSDPQPPIRPATAADAPGIRAVHEQAFESDGAAGLVEALDAAGETISLVAEHAGAVVGHIMLSPMKVVGTTQTWPCLALAPLAVLPAHQRCGIGSRLSETAIAAGRAAGARFMLVLGDPAYYGRFGFTSSLPHGITPPDPKWGDAFQALALREGALEGVEGQAVYPPAFDGV